MTAADQPIDAARAKQIEQEFEAERPMRELSPLLSRGLALCLVLFAIYHYVTAGTGIPVDYWHMGIHLSGVLIALFILFPRASHGRRAGLAIGGVPVADWLLGLTGAAAALWIGFSWEGFDVTLFGHRFRLAEQAMRQGDPATIDIVFGTALIAIVLEATRRVIGWVLPIIVLVFVGFALFGPYMPFDILKHPGVHWGQFVNNVYFPAEGIFGIPLWVVSTVVFHFVLLVRWRRRWGSAACSWTSRRSSPAASSAVRPRCRSYRRRCSARSRGPRSRMSCRPARSRSRT
jgi:TRAP-type uncharacterized transport system fused permease subunit